MMEISYSRSVSDIKCVPCWIWGLRASLARGEPSCPCYFSGWYSSFWVARCFPVPCPVLDCHLPSCPGECAQARAELTGGSQSGAGPVQLCPHGAGA